jgi:hypothetical protein
VSRFELRGGRPRRLRARASFVPMPGLDPLRTGVTLELRRRDGRLLFSALVPREAFRMTRRRGARRYVAVPRRGRGLGGLTRLVLTVWSGVADVAAKGTSPGLVEAGREPAIGLALRFEEACVRDADLQCSGGGGLTSCR